MDPIIITVSPADKPGEFHAFVGPDLLCTSTQPLLASARRLIKLGYSGDRPLEMCYAGSETVTLRAKSIAAAAELRVNEFPGGKTWPSFERWRLPNRLRSGCTAPRAMPEKREFELTPSGEGQ